MKSKLFFLVLLSLFVSSCKHTHPTTSDEEHEDEKIQFITYTDEFELFAEADPFVKGETSNVLAHFTRLPNFKALESGTVSIQLNIDGNSTTQTLDKPDRKGIYSFDIKPEKSGAGDIQFVIETDSGNYKITTPDIHVHASHAETHAHAHVDLPTTNSIVFTKEQSWKIDFSTDLPQKEAFGQVIKTIAQIQSAQADEIIVSAKTNGIIRLAQQEIFEGKDVFKGEHLFSISGSQFADNNISVRYGEARNNFEQTKADYERASTLAKDKIVSEKELRRRKNLYDNAKSSYEILQRNFSTTGQQIKSSMKGFIKQVFIKNGSYVEAGQPIASISQNKVLILNAEIQQKYIPILGTIIGANIHTMHDNRVYTLEELNGKILSYAKSTNKDNYLIPVTIQIDNKASFIPGGFVEIYLKTLTNSYAKTISNTAIVEEQGNYFVYVQTTPELFEKRVVKLGITDGLKTELLEGVDADERIVTKGAILLKLAQETGTLDAHSGHVH